MWTTDPQLSTTLVRDRHRHLSSLRGVRHAGSAVDAIPSPPSPAGAVPAEVVLPEPVGAGRR